jgi:DNA-binding XRE family transcriptional regulator
MQEMAAADLDNFRVNVKSLCAEYGELKAMADAVGVTRQYLGNMLNGSYRPSMDLVIAISEHVELPISTLFLPPKDFKKNLAKAV